MSFMVTLYRTKKCLHIASIHINFHQNWFINECARMKKAEFAELRNYIKTDFFGEL